MTLGAIRQISDWSLVLGQRAVVSVKGEDAQLHAGALKSGADRTTHPKLLSYVEHCRGAMSESVWIVSACPQIIDAVEILGFSSEFRGALIPHFRL